MSSYQVFARKYRPQGFDDVVGQEHITRTLKNAIEQNRLAHAYLFVGPRGTGKTSTARILAKALNCIHGPTISPCGVCDACVEISEGRSLDVLEFDAASNTQVDKIREIIIDNVKFAPTRGQYKLYLVDEVHMLSNSSFNALLKTLEEPPAHVKFLFATTDPQKVPTTILSRCQRFDLKRIPDILIARHLQFIAGKEKIELAESAAAAIARGADGGLRDAESMLDQLVAFCGGAIGEPEVLQVFGFTSQETISSLSGFLFHAQSPQALHLINEQAEAGKDLMKVLNDLLGHLRNLLIFQVDPSSLDQDLAQSTRAVLQEQASLVVPAKLLDLIAQFSTAESRMKWAANKKLQLEIAVIRGVQTLQQATLDDVLQTLTTLRDSPTGESAEPKAPTTRPQPRAVVPPPAPVVPRKEPIAAPSPAQETIAEKPPAEIVLSEEPVPLPAPAAILSPVPEVEQPVEPEVAEPADEPEPAPAAAVEDFWPEFIREVRAKRPLLRSIVETALPEMAGNNVLTLVFARDQQFACDNLARANNRALLEEILSRLRHKPTTFRTEMRDGVIPPAPRVAEEVKPVEIDPLAAFKNDPLIQKALELFKAEIQSAQPAEKALL